MEKENFIYPNFKNMNKISLANIILVAAIVILLGAVGYFTFVRKSKPTNNQPSTMSNTINTNQANPILPTPSPTPTPLQAAPSEPGLTTEHGLINHNSQGYLYTNDYYGFKLQFPGSFEGLKVKMENDSTDSSVKYFRFQVPKSKCTSSGDACYMNPITAGVYPKSVWQNWSKEPPLNNREVKTNASYSITVSPWQDLGEITPAAEQISADITKVQSSLEVYKSNDSTINEKSSNWDNYEFELEDITKKENLVRDPVTGGFPFDTAIWRVDKKTGEREIFISSTEEAAGGVLMNVDTPEIESYSGKMLKIKNKIYLQPYNGGTDRPNSAYWQLNLDTKKFEKLSISEFLGDFGIFGENAWSPDRTKIIDTEDKENDQTLRILDIQKDSAKIIATTSGNKNFAYYIGLGVRGPIWIDNDTVRVRIYDIKACPNDGCGNKEPSFLEERIININD